MSTSRRPHCQPVAGHYWPVDALIFARYLRNKARMRCLRGTQRLATSLRRRFMMLNCVCLVSNDCLVWLPGKWYCHRHYFDSNEKSRKMAKSRVQSATTEQTTKHSTSISWQIKTSRLWHQRNATARQVYDKH